VKKNKKKMEKKIKVTDEKKVYSGNISLRVDKFKLNKKIIEKEVVEHLPSIGLIPIIDSDDILLVTQYRHAAGKIVLEIPAGKIEKGETPEQAALREMREEVGYTGELSQILQWYLAPGYSTELMYIFIVTNLKKIKRGNLDEDENIVIKRMKLNKALEKCINGEIEDCKTIAALLAYAKISEFDR
jgi:ADP-ribose pyrophosphatase